MKSFKAFLKEAQNRIRTLDAADQTKFDKAIAPYVYDIKKSGRSATTVIVRSPGEERENVKKDIEKKLKAAKYDFEQSRSGGSTGSTIVEVGDHKIQITYKPISGGMSETTLNATITELAPALAFMANKKFTTVKKFYDFLLSTSDNRYGVYVNDRDAEAGKKFIMSMPSSSLFNDKMENAIAILKYLYDLNSETPIQQVFWGYRAKPDNVSATHKGDLFVKFTNGNMLGVSLKAGGEKTKEPQLNTYVNKFFDDIGFINEKNALMDKVYQSIHSKIGLPRDWDSRSKKSDSIETIEAFKNENPDEYEKMYDDMLEIIRESLINAVNKDISSTIDYIKKQILKKDDFVPLIVIKAVGKKYSQITDEDDLGAFIPQVSSIEAYKSTSSKQNWLIDLEDSSGNKITMNMSVRSNKTPPQNKIAQGFNLAIKFNGIS